MSPPFILYLAALSAAIVFVRPESGGGGPSPRPAISSLTPASAAAGGPGFTLTVEGSHFTPSSTVRWNGSPRGTRYVDSGRLDADVPPSDLLAAGAIAVTVEDAGSEGPSNPALFTVHAEPGVPPASSPSKSALLPRP